MVSPGKNYEIYNKIRELASIRRFIVGKKEHIEENDAAELYHATHRAQELLYSCTDWCCSEIFNI